MQLARPVFQYLFLNSVQAGCLLRYWWTRNTYDLFLKEWTFNHYWCTSCLGWLCRQNLRRVHRGVLCCQKCSFFGIQTSQGSCHSSSLLTGRHGHWSPMVLECLWDTSLGVGENTRSEMDSCSARFRVALFSCWCSAWSQNTSNNSRGNLFAADAKRSDMHSICEALKFLCTKQWPPTAQRTVMDWSQTYHRINQPDWFVCLWN